MKTQHYKNGNFLVDTDWLERHLDDVDLRVYDCSVNVQPNPDTDQSRQFPFVFTSGRAGFDLGHVPRAGFIDIPGELSDLSSPLPLMLPPEEHFRDVMSNYGVNDDSRVVLYSSTEPNWPARVWWMLRAYGFDNAVILNGGWAKWVDEDRPVSDRTCEYSPGQFNTRYRPGAIVDRDLVLGAIDDGDTCIINGLPAPMYTGASDFAFGRKGRITSSVNVPFSSLHDPETGCYLPIDQLQRIFSEVELNFAKPAINYCGAGIAASNNAFVLTLLGHTNVSVYDGSMFEWGNDPSLPMEMD